MVPVTSLWLPILASAVIVFVVSAIIHMVLGYHRTDLMKAPNEDAVMEALRRLSLAPGDYGIPHPGSPAGMRDPAFIDKMAKGPITWMTIAPGKAPGMGKNLVQWFAYSILVGFFSAYITGRALGPGANYLQVFRFVGSTAFMGYSLALLQNSIWGMRAWSTTLKGVFDGLIFACMTAGTFGWLWPR